MAISATATKKDVQFVWEGKDKRGHKVRGKALAANEQALRADLRRQGVAATRVKTQRKAGGGKVQPQDIAVFARQLATIDQLSEGRVSLHVITGGNATE